MHATDTGDATLMVGYNSQETFDRVLPILRAMAKYAFHMGELGAGYAMKTLNNYIKASGYGTGGLFGGWTEVRLGPNPDDRRS
jgi:3-hydroxyisobutyrate dehydrogenase-like beta-hydroxyacid dehydrogenase